MLLRSALKSYINITLKRKGYYYKNYYKCILRKDTLRVLEGAESYSLATVLAG